MLSSLLHPQPKRWQSAIGHVETRGGLANVSQIRMQAPLHETADELCVASDIGADMSEMRLGTRAPSVR